MAEATPKSRILIADDNGPNVELLEAYLSDLDCQIEVAVDGRDTLAKVASFEPDLILLDVMMPKLSGFEVCQKLKADAATRKIMVLMVTALNEAGDIERAVRFYQKAIELAPVQKAEIHLRLATLYNAAGLKDRAVEEYKAFLGKVPGHADAEKFKQYIRDNSPTKP